MSAIPWPEQYLLHIEKKIDIGATATIVFEALLEQLGPGADRPDGTLMPMKLEPWPGGRWYRDLGSNAGHFWGHVQVIKPPSLLEITGPMFMSYPVISHVQYRLTEQSDGTRLSLLHRAIGDIGSEHRQGADKGWEHIMSRIKGRALQ
ncbi:MAG: SRPBCC domain-containing protein [Phycisphaerae bacterium]|nr:SRPBCC domain-containing protein [Phycisphaerae bacterium]